MEDLPALVLAGFALSGSPGPATLARAFRHPRVGRAINLTCAALLVASVALALLR